MHLRGATIVAYGNCCQLALKLLLTTDTHGLVSGAAERLVLIHPILPSTTVNALLTGGTAHTARVDVVFDSEEASGDMLPRIRKKFPSGVDCVWPTGCAIKYEELLSQLLSTNDQPDGTLGTLTELPALDP